MASYITFPHENTAGVFNSSFRTLHAFLIERQTLSPVVRAVLEKNPIAAEIKYLNLSEMTPHDLEALSGEFRLLTESADLRTGSEYLQQFIKDMEAVQIALEKSIPKSGI